MKKTLIIIESYDAPKYIKSLLAVRRKLIKAFEQSDDGSIKGWVNKHGPIIDELLEELGYKGRL